MRWLKHLAMAHEDSAIVEILEQLGPEGYGMYWLLLEYFAALIERDTVAIPAATNTVVRWSQICHCSARKLREFVRIATDLKLIDSRSEAELKQFASRLKVERLQIEVPKLLKYRDEYTKKSGQTPDKLLTEETQLETQLETQKDAETHIQKLQQRQNAACVRPIRAADLTSETSERWEEFRDKYPVKFEIDNAARQFISVVTKANEKIVFDCLDRYLESDTVSRGAIYYPAKWLEKCHKDKWLSDWPKAKSAQPSGRTSADRMADEVKRLDMEKANDQNRTSNRPIAKA